MKFYRAQRRVALLGLLLFLVACMTPAIPPDPDPQIPGDSLNRNPEESFDPLRLPEDQILLPARAEPDTAADSTKGSTLPAPDATREGFQVQIHSGRELESAQEVQAQALLLFPDHPVELVWTRPITKSGWVSLLPGKERKA